MKLASQASALECRGELGVCVMVFVVKAHDARLAQLIHNFLKYLREGYECSIISLISSPDLRNLVVIGIE